MLVGLRATASILVTLLAALLPAAVRAVTRGALYPTAWVGSRTCRIWARSLCAILGVRIRVLGTPPIGGAFVVVANHLSYLDIMVLGSL